MKTAKELFTNVFDPEWRCGLKPIRIGDRDVYPKPVPVPKAAHQAVVDLIQDDEHLDDLLHALTIDNVKHVVRTVWAAHTRLKELDKLPGLLRRSRARAEAVCVNALLFEEFLTQWAHREQKLQEYRK